MRGLTTLLIVVLFGAGSVRAETVYSGNILDVETVDVNESYIPDYGPVVSMTLRIHGWGGFMPSSFDGVVRDGVVNGATGITGADLYHPWGYDSRFLNDPADLMIVDPLLIPGYVPDPEALTGVFVIIEPGAVSSAWDLAEIIVPPSSLVMLDFTIGQVGDDRIEYVGATFTAPGSPDLPGDCDGDGDVDLDDFVILKNNFGTSSSQGDVDGDGDVDLDDFVILKSNFGSAAAVPEPATVVLLVAGSMILRRRRTVDA